MTLNTDETTTPTPIDLAEELERLSKFWNIARFTSAACMEGASALRQRAVLVEALQGLVSSCTRPDGSVSPEPLDRGEWLEAMVAARAALQQVTK